MQTNKVEILRAICFTQDDMNTIQNLNDAFTDKEIEFMGEFKKIYEFGVNQLEIFINKLDEEGKDLDTYTIQYYIDVLRSGPLSEYVKTLSEGKKYFPNTPDSMGGLGNKTKCPSNTTLFETMGYSLGCAVDTFNKLPAFMQKTLIASTDLTEDIFRSGLTTSTVIDNTLPIMDKKPQDRYNEEDPGKWVLKSNGSYLVKDNYYYLAVSRTAQDIFDKIEEYLQTETFRMWSDKKEYFPFDSDKNTSTSSNDTVEKQFTDGDSTEIIVLDLMGDIFDSDERRKSALKIENDSKNKEYILSTNEGQLGN